MQYFVSVENSSYFYWQLELLIESFLMQGMEKNLVIGLAENDEQKIRGFSSNLVKHGTKFLIRNEGRELGYNPINRINSIRYAMAYGILKLPFVMIHADMILKKPIEFIEGDEEYGLIINNFDELSDQETKEVGEEVDHFADKFAEDRSVKKDEVTKVPFFSAPVIFNKSMEYCSEMFFSKVQSYENLLLEKKGAEFPCERAAWEISIAEAFQHFAVRGRFMSAPMMYDGEDFNFIHYRSGIPPVFHKKFFRYEGGTYYSSMGPYETIMEHNPTVNTNYLHQVIRSYNKRNSR
jgi:hypothetical protein